VCRRRQDTVVYSLSNDQNYSAIPAEKVTEPALLTGFSGERLRKPLSESLAASGLAGFAGMAENYFMKVQMIPR
jgi:hypothetical protein